MTGLAGGKSNGAVIVGVNFSAGVIAGVISAGATCPLDVAKTRRQIEASACLFSIGSSVFLKLLLLFCFVFAF